MKYFALLLALLGQACVSDGEGLNLDALLSAPASNKKYPKTAQFSPMELKAGQSTTYILTSQNGDKQIYRWTVDSREEKDSSMWVSEYLQQNHWKVQLALDDSRQAVANQQQSKFQATMSDFGTILRVVSRTDASSAYHESQYLAHQMPALATAISWTSAAEWGKTLKTTTKVGVFRCHLAKVTISQGKTLNGCFDPSVPGNGLVGGKDSTGTLWELVSLSFDGAEAP